MHYYGEPTLRYVAREDEYGVMSQSLGPYARGRSTAVESSSLTPHRAVGIELLGTANEEYWKAVGGKPMPATLPVDACKQTASTGAR